MNNFVKYWVNLIVLIAITCLFANIADGTTSTAVGEGAYIEGEAFVGDTELLGVSGGVGTEAFASGGYSIGNGYGYGNGYGNGFGNNRLFPNQFTPRRRQCMPCLPCIPLCPGRCPPRRYPYNSGNSGIPDNRGLPGSGVEYTPQLIAFLNGQVFYGTAFIIGNSFTRLACSAITRRTHVVALPIGLMPNLTRPFQNVLCTRGYCVQVSVTGYSIIVVPKEILDTSTTNIALDATSFQELNSLLGATSVRVSYRLVNCPYGFEY